MIGAVGADGYPVRRLLVLPGGQEVRRGTRRRKPGRGGFQGVFLSRPLIWATPPVQVATEQLHGDVLHRIERSTGVQLDRRTPRYGTQGMTAGFRTEAGTWVRVQWRRPSKIYGPAWAGAECASVLRGVTKPDWFQTASWRDDLREVVWRADEMELVSFPVVDSSGVVATEPVLAESWWASLKDSLAALAEHQTERVGVRQDHLTRRINQAWCQVVDAPPASTSLDKESVEDFGRFLPVECLPWTVVEFVCDGVEFGLRVA